MSRFDRVKVCHGLSEDSHHDVWFQTEDVDRQRIDYEIRDGHLFRLNGVDEQGERIAFDPPLPVELTGTIRCGATLNAGTDAEHIVYEIRFVKGEVRSLTRRPIP